MDTATEKWNKFKPQLIEFFQSVKEELAKEAQGNEQKVVNFEIEGGNDSTKGIGMQIYSIKGDEYNQIVSNPQPYMADALVMATLSINAVSIEGVGLLETLFNSMIPMFEEIPGVKQILEKGEYKLRTEGTKMSLDFVVKNAEVLKKMLELGINPAEFFIMKFIFGSAVKFGDFFEMSLDQLLEKILSIHFSIENNLINITYLFKAIIDSLEKVQMPDEKIKKKINKAIFYLKAVSTLISMKFDLKYSPKEAAEFLMKSPFAIDMGGKEVLAEQLEQYKTMGEGMGKEMIKGQLEALGLLDPAKAANIDNIKLALLCPKYQTGLVQEFKFPGLTALLHEKFL